MVCFGAKLLHQTEVFFAILPGTMQFCFENQYEMSLNAIELDSFDLAILRILQNNNAMPQREIGEEVSLSAAAVQRRIKRMEESGVIRSNIAVLDPMKIGQLITLFVEVEVESEKIELIDQIKARFAAAEEVQQCYYVTGDADFILIINVATMADYERLSRQLFFDNSNVRKFRTFVTMDRVKVGLSVPL